MANDLLPAQFSLFQLSNAFRILDEKLELMAKDGELIEVSKDELKTLIETKADLCAEYNDMLSSFGDQIDQRIKYFQVLKKVNENKKERYKQYLLSAMESGNLEEILGVTRKISLKKNPPRVDIYDQDSLPVEFVEIVQTINIKKKEIADALKKGEVIPGAKLVQGRSIQIR